MLYCIYDKTINKSYELSIGDIIKYIRKNKNNEIYKKIENKLILVNNTLVNKTLFICHRINTLTQLQEIDNVFGVELDIRDTVKSSGDLTNIESKKQLILAHDPFSEGESFEEYLSYFKHDLIILNIKSERIEHKCLDLLNKFKINNYFFLDSSFPMIYLLNTKYDNNKIAYRYSEYETLENLKNNPHFYEWIWIDCFNNLPINHEIYKKTQDINKKICIVSPELQGQEEKIITYKHQLENSNVIPDAICCKLKNIITWI